MRVPGASVVAMLALTQWGATGAPQWDDLGSSLGVVERVGGTMVPVFFDVDLDGRADPLWLSHDGVDALHINADGQASLVAVDMPLSLSDEGGPTLLGLVFDTDDDGTDELMVFGTHMGVLSPDGPHRLVLGGPALPALPGASVGDVAVGDLNADGLADVVIGLGVFSLERIERRGYGDVVLMNRGEGRFELGWLEPVRPGFTHGLTLVDVDADGRLDVVESVNSSQLAGAARILLNRTQPGALNPTFEVASFTHDGGTNGMGAAVGDLDGDGLLDFYNTSVGLDLLCMGNAQGGCDDATLARGLLAEWGQVSLRQQWSPFFADVNGDGRLDILVRHGGVGAASVGALGWQLSESEADLVYVQEIDRTFRRTEVPFERGVATQGRQLVLGDVDDDGLPDVALGGHVGSGGFWRNVTPVDPETPRFTVRFQATVSTSPPTGARVVGRCGDMELHRQLTSGGRMGGSPAAEVFLAFPGCTENPTVTVHWPSGAITAQEAPPGQHVVTAQEPVWLVSSLDTSGTVVLDPGPAGAAKACLPAATGPPTCCAAEDGPCTLAVPMDMDPAPLVQLDGGPLRALPAQTSRYRLLTVPATPRPGDPVVLHVMHVGDPALFVPEELALFVDGEPLGWSQVDPATRTLLATLNVAEEASVMTVTLFPQDIPPAATWIRATGFALDPVWSLVDAYRYRVTGGVTEPWNLEFYVTFVRGPLISDITPHVSLTTTEGDPVEATIIHIPQSVARLRLQVPRAAVEELDQLVLRDGSGGTVVPIAIPAPLDLEAAAERIDRAVGGVAKHRLVEAGDASPVFFWFLDEAGDALPPEPELVSLEVDGGEVLAAPLGFAGTYNLYGMIRTAPGTGPGAVHVRALDGRIVGTFPFSRRPAGNSGVAVAQSSAVLSPEPDAAHPVTHAVMVTPRNEFGEMVGPNALVSLDVQGGEVVTPATLDPSGGLKATLGATPGADKIAVDIYVDDQFLVTLSAALDWPSVPDGDPGDVVDQGAIDAPPEPDSPGSSPGCGGCGSGPGGQLPWDGALMLLLVLGWLGRTRGGRP